MPSKRRCATYRMRRSSSTPGTTHNFAVPGVPGYDPAVAALAEERVFDVFDRLKDNR